MSERRSLSHSAMLGLKELPSNTAWLLSKAFGPVVETTANATDGISGSVSGLGLIRNGRRR